MKVTFTRSALAVVGAALAKAFDPGAKPAPRAARQEKRRRQLAQAAESVSGDAAAGRSRKAKAPQP